MILQLILVFRVFEFGFQYRFFVLNLFNRYLRIWESFEIRDQKVYLSIVFGIQFEFEIIF